MKICKPPHNRYALWHLNNETYIKYDFNDIQVSDYIKFVGQSIFSDKK